MQSLDVLNLPKNLQVKLQDAGITSVETLIEKLNAGRLRVPGIGDANEEVVRRAVANSKNPNSLSPSHPHLETRFFVVGIILLIVAVGLGTWAFAARELSADQREILRWAFALASGFACGSFGGAFSIRTYGVSRGLGIAATGGFAVWYLTYFSLFTELAAKNAPIENVAASAPGPIDPPTGFPGLTLSGMKPLTEQDRSKDGFKATVVTVRNDSKKRIKVGFDYEPSRLNNAQIAKSLYVHRETVEINAGETIDHRDKNFGGPVHISILADGKWTATNEWFDLRVVPRRTLIVIENQDSFDCRVEFEDVNQ